MHAAAQDFQWTQELEKTVVNSLVTSFGLDFLLFQDKTGGEVDTIHNVRQDIWASEAEKQRYEQSAKYDGTAYHQHETYIATGRADKKEHESGTLLDAYRKKELEANAQRNLDHVISAKEIHDDAGRVLAGLDGVQLANQASNLQSTHETVNKSKKQAPISDYLQRLPGLIVAHEQTLVNERMRLASLPRETPEQLHKARALEDKIRKDEAKITELKAIDPEAMRERDAQARATYEQQINQSYYSSSRFLKQTAKASGIAGLAMGTRQMLGLVMAEIWFELREQLPALLGRLKDKFTLEAFLDSMADTLKGIWSRIQKRFSAFLLAFKDGVFAGVLGSLTTTLFNILVTTQAMAAKIIREVWGQLVKVIKLMVFNPDQLGFVEVCQAVVVLLSAGAATVAGSVIYTQLLPMCSFPFGAELAAFASALVTGITGLGLTYFLLHSSVARKLWTYIESIMPHAGTVKQFQDVNAELDRYLAELAKVEFNLDVEELKDFSNELDACSNEVERGAVLHRTVGVKGLELPFEFDNPQSTRTWLASLI